MIQDTIKFSKRIPRNKGNDVLTVPIAFIEIPSPDPSEAVSIVDVASGTIEDSESRAIDIAFPGIAKPVELIRSSVSNDPSTLYPTSIFIIPGPDPNIDANTTIQETLCSPIKVLRVDEDASGSWNPILSRGTFYRIWQLNSKEGPDSWIYNSFPQGIDSYALGDYFLLQYTTELDWRLLAGGDSWNGTCSSGGGSLWNIKRTASYTPSSRIMNITPAGLTGGQESSVITALGGIRTDQGIELLTEHADYNSSNSMLAPGNRSGTIGSFTLNTYNANYSSSINNIMTQGRIQSDTPRNTGLISYTTLNSTVSYNTIITSLSESSIGDNSVVTFSGSIYAPEDNFYTIQATANGKCSFYHWNIPVVNKTYGQPNSGLIRDALYTPYLHEGWHDFTITWVPETSTTNACNFTLNLGGLIACSNTTTRSQVVSVDVNTGEVILSQGYVGGNNTTNPPTLVASYAVSQSSIPLRGYFDPNISSGTWQGLDLNPSPNRTYEDLGQESPTSDWIQDTCWVWLVPSMACPLTQGGGPISSDIIRHWVPCFDGGINSTLRWGKVNASTTISSGTSVLGSPFGSLSTYSGGVLGQSTFISSGSAITATGINPAYDPRGSYDSGFVIGHISLSNALPELSNVRIHDIRLRGGGLSYEIDPSVAISGIGQEKVNTFYDMSSFDLGASVNGTVLVEIPEAIITGSDGRPSFSPDEINQIIRNSLASGIKPIIKYI